MYVCRINVPRRRGCAHKRPKPIKATFPLLVYVSSATLLLDKIVLSFRPNSLPHTNVAGTRKHPDNDELERSPLNEIYASLQLPNYHLLAVGCTYIIMILLLHQENRSSRQSRCRTDILLGYAGLPAVI